MPPKRRRPGRDAAWQRSAWKRGPLRRAAYERDGYRCRGCGALGKQKGGPARLTLQHIRPIYDRLPLLHEVKTLCDRCHGREDGGKRYTWGGQPL